VEAEPARNPLSYSRDAVEFSAHASWSFAQAVAKRIVVEDPQPIFVVGPLEYASGVKASWPISSEPISRVGRSG
jgi:hypothetical protein